MSKKTQQEHTGGKTLEGVVVSDKMQSTAVVKVERFEKHPKYGKYVKTSKRYKAHNEGDEYKEGDKVIIKEVRPMSKTKSFKIISKR